MSIYVKFVWEICVQLWSMDVGIFLLLRLVMVSSAILSTLSAWTSKCASFVQLNCNVDYEQISLIKLSADSQFKNNLPTLILICMCCAVRTVILAATNHHSANQCRGQLSLLRVTRRPCSTDFNVNNEQPTNSLLYLYIFVTWSYVDNK